MSLHELIKQTMSKNLEKKHYELLKLKLGEDHPLSVRQQIHALNQNLVSENLEQSQIITSLTKMLKDQKLQLKAQRKNAAQLECVDLDDILDTAAEVKSVSDNIKETLLAGLESD